MKNLVAVIVLMCLPLWANAGQPLSRELIKSFYVVSAKMDNIGSKYPEITKHADGINLSNSSELARYLEASKMYPEIKSILTSAGFRNLDDFFNVSQRLMGGVYAVQMQKMPKGTNLKQMETSFKASIKSMKNSGASAAIIARMEADFKQQQAQQKAMKIAAKNLSDQDKKFVSENFDWIMKSAPDLAN